jgi:iron complex outermembrane receptor protein
MNRFIGWSVLLSTTTLSFGVIVPAFAEEEALNEIIVTARRVEERLQDVPISITVFNQEQLTEKNVLSARDLATYAPSLSVNGRYGTENSSFAIRGFSQEIRTTPSVAIYFADVVAPRASGSGTPAGDGAGPGSFFDLQNVQILRGPQGTLFGRNTTGGAILLVPQKPTSTVEGYIEQSAGNYGMLRTQAVLNLPFGESVRFRAGLDYNKRDGYLRNTSGVGPGDFADVNYIAGRASLVWDIAASVENYTIASYSRSDNNGQVPRLFVCNPGFRLGNFACAQLAKNAATGADGRFDVQNDVPNPQARTKQWQAINTTTWIATDTFTIKNIVSYAQLENDLNAALFGTNFFVGPFPLISNVSLHPPGLHSASQSTLTEELQLQGRSDDNRLTWQAGGYYESSKGIDPSGAQSPATINCTNSETLNCFDVLGAATGRPTGTVNWQVGETTFRNLGVYAQSSYNLLEPLKLTAGIRYTKDRSETDDEIAIRRFPAPTYRQPVTFCNNSDTGHGYTEVVSSVNACGVHYAKDSSAPTWLLGLDYKLTEDVLAYGKYSRGYRQGSVQPFSVPGHTTYDPEKVNAYELGLKTSFDAPIRGTFNVAAFYNKLTDQQLLYGFGSSTNSAPGNAAIVNAGASRVYGAEVDTALLLFHGFRVSLAYAYLNTKVQELAVIPPNPATGYDVSLPLSVAGDPLPYSTKHKLSADVNYTLPLAASIGAVSVGATYTYQSALYISRSSPYGIVPSYSLVNTNLNWNGIFGSGFDVALFVTNAFDKEYRSAITNSWGSFGYEIEVPGEPRMYGARLRYRFGT